MRALRELPRGVRLLAGLSLLGSLALAILAAITLATPALANFESWFGIPPEPRVTGLARMLVVAVIMTVAAALIAAIWCAVTSVWVRLTINRGLLAAHAVEAIARGRYFG